MEPKAANWKDLDGVVDADSGTNAAALQMPSKPQRIAPGELHGINRVQVGCGPTHLRNAWWNTDIRQFPGVDEVMDATLPWRWTDQLDFVYGEHFLEHLDIDQAVSFLVNAGNALSVNGRLRLSTPGLEWVMQTHYSLTEKDLQKQIRSTFGTNRAFHGWGHRFLYSQALLRAIMTEAGYADVQFFDYGKSETADLANLEMHGGWSVVNNFPSVWIVEGRRSEAPLVPPTQLLSQIEADFLRHVRSKH